MKKVTVLNYVDGYYYYPDIIEELKTYEDKKVSIHSHHRHHTTS